MNTSLKPGLLDRTITLRQIVRTLVIALIIAVCIYIPAFLIDSWNRQMRSDSYRASPYYAQIPPECRLAGLSAISISGQGDSQTTLDSLLMRPYAWAYSLPDSEKKLGIGMMGLRCMGYRFLAVLHSPGYKHIDRYVDEKGLLIATVSIEVHNAYRTPDSPEILEQRPYWPELNQLGIPASVRNDLSLVPVPNRSVK